MRDSDHRPSEPILHLDMDAFYAAVEVRDDARLRGRPVLVGGRGGRGVVASASYEARAFGVGSAMPMGEALRRCPGAVVIAPRFDRYTAVSRELHEILRSVTPLVEPLALDEAFLDVGGSVRLLGSPVEIAARLRRSIATELRLPASVGVAANKFLAKLCSRKAKPDGLLHLPAARAEEFVAALAVGELWGVGRQTAVRLERAGIRWVRDLMAMDRGALARLVGGTTADRLLALARGRDARTVEPHVDAKGLSAEQTFERDLVTAGELHRVLLSLSERVGRRLRHNGVRARTVTLKLRHASFQTVTRAHTLAASTNQANEVFAVATELLDGVWSAPSPVRLLGVAASRLVSGEQGVQMDLLGSARWEAAERVADQVRAQFGDVALTRGALLGDAPGTTAPSRDDLRGPRYHAPRGGPAPPGKIRVQEPRERNGPDLQA
jgi:DNA polymerase-4